MQLKTNIGSRYLYQLIFTKHKSTSLHFANGIGSLYLLKNYITLYSVIKLSNDSKMYVKVKKKTFMKIR